MFAGLPVEIDDPIERLRAVASSMTGAKVMHEDMGGTTLEDWAEVAAPRSSPGRCAPTRGCGWGSASGR